MSFFGVFGWVWRQTFGIQEIVLGVDGLAGLFVCLKGGLIFGLFVKGGD